MHPLDLVIVVVYLAYVMIDGVRRSKNTTDVEGYFLASRSLPWWAVGLSVMATQLSAVTMIGTTGQGATDGLRLVQLYFGLPLAMIIISLTLVPFFHRARVFTAYEYLERRFDSRTRTLTSLLFLIQRGLSCGTIVSAPAIVFSVMLGWSIEVTVAAIGVPTIVYTMLGGVQAVTWADVKQMVLIVFGLVAMVVAIVLGFPEHIGLSDALALAGTSGRLRAIDFSVTPFETYTFWSGLIGGLFLMMSYFGTDQSQVQRYLTAKSVDEARTSLMMSAYWKIPLQVLVLMIGVLVFVYYHFAPPPMLFNPVDVARVKASGQSATYAALETDFDKAWQAQRDAAEAFVTARRASGTNEGVEAERLARTQADVTALRNKAREVVSGVTRESARDVNYIIPTFILTKLPIGLAGLLIAAIMAAAMSSIAAELNSLATASIIDFYRGRFKPGESDGHYLMASKVATGVWGVFACVVALYAGRLGSLIEVVNWFGSFFYGSILGVFLLGTMTTRATGRGAFTGTLLGLASVAAVAQFIPSLSYLWYNVIGAVVVFASGYAISLLDSPHATATH
jgi:SSS family transporter